MTSYVFDNEHSATPKRFNALETLFDAHSIENLEAVGIGSGWHCLDVGAGGGSITRWLSAAVGSEGRVTATDIDTRFLEDLGGRNIQVLRRDIVVDELPENQPSADVSQCALPEEQRSPQCCEDCAEINGLTDLRRG